MAKYLSRSCPRCTAIEQTRNGLAAYIGEVEDILQRKIGEQDRIKPKP